MNASKLGSALLSLVAIGMVALSLTPSAISADTITYIGVSGDYDGSCTVNVCNNGSGCRITADIWDQWYPGKECSGPPNPGSGGCLHNFRLCRDIQHWDDQGCSGMITYHEWVNQAMCAGGGEPHHG